ncbi:hypothetical protein RclHR1_00550014 [Rhizophagus clarus]|uniref:GATA-binding factor A isoform X1 n=1 Tax=Rhizophagus clarus TaxID=94130 RepID=A0A2Z6SFT1_9GLOM|nr:hypothetical protein RclHR1_00550014 [Rhizophagus clarus]GES80239.1 GATA-binding factor A isoform X1 [Rhizophagus clarus]
MSATDPEFPESSSPRIISSSQENDETDFNDSSTFSTSNDSSTFNEDDEKSVPSSLISPNNYLSLHNICNIIQNSFPAVRSQKLENDFTSQCETSAIPDNIIENLSKFNENSIRHDNNFTNNVHYNEPNSIYQSNSKQIYGQNFHPTTMLSIVSPDVSRDRESIICTNPFCLQCRYTTTPHHTNLPYPVSSGPLPFPVQYYFSLPNNPVYSTCVPPSSVYIQQQQPLKSETPISSINLTSEDENYSDVKSECSECTAQTKKRRRRKPKATLNSSTYSRKNKHMTRSGEIYCCSNCGTKETPAWRRDLRGIALLCNACGLYLKVKGHNRPVEVDADGEIRLVKLGSTGAAQAKCQNCGARETPCWREPEGKLLCNRCGLFFKQNGYNRPLTPQSPY